MVLPGGRSPLTAKACHSAMVKTAASVTNRWMLARPRIRGTIVDIRPNGDGRPSLAPRAPDAPDAQAIFARRGWLASASAQDRARIIALGRVVRLARGARLFAAGDAPGGIYGVLAGGIGAEGSTSRHLPRLGHVLRAGDWFGHGPVLTGGPRLGFVAV